MIQNTSLALFSWAFSWLRAPRKAVVVMIDRWMVGWMVRSFLVTLSIDPALQPRVGCCWPIYILLYSPAHPPIILFESHLLSRGEKQVIGFLSLFCLFIPLIFYSYSLSLINGLGQGQVGFRFLFSFTKLVVWLAGLVWI